MQTKAYLMVIIGLLIVEILTWVLFPTFLQFINGAGLNAVNVSGTVTDYSFAGTIAVIFYVLVGGLAPIGALVYVIKNMG